MADSPRAGLKKPLRLPGDLLGFSECSPTGAAIRACTGGLICCGGLSHVAIITWWPPRELSARARPVRTMPPLLCESTSLCREPCLIQERQVSGVQVHHIRSRVLAYNRMVWHFPLTTPLDWEQVGLLHRFCKQQRGLCFSISQFRIEARCVAVFVMLKHNLRHSATASNVGYASAYHNSGSKRGVWRCLLC